MKRTPLKRGTKQLKRTPFKRKQATRGSKSPSKSIYKWKSPRWFKSIPDGSHGNTGEQKKLWKLTSDYVRIHDFYKYGNRCVSFPVCGKHFDTWKDGQAAHFKAWGASNSYFKFNLLNLALSCSNCNRKDDGEVGHYFGKELERRHGKDIFDTITKLDNANRGVKMEGIKLVEMARELIKKFEDLPEKPDYWDKMMKNYED